MKTTLLSTLLASALLAACASGGGSPNTVVGYAPVAATPPSATKTIDSFTVSNADSVGARGIVNRFDSTIKLYLPAGASLATLTPTITLESGYTISPASGTAADFTIPSDHTLTYTVTKTSNGSTTAYAVQAINGAAPTAATVDAWLGRGINLGNDLDAWPGDEGSWTGGVVAKETFFDDYKALGFDSVRIPITWGQSTTPRMGTASPYNVVPSFMNRVDTVAGWGIDHGLAVVINAHHEDWIRTKTGTDFDTALLRFEALWTQIAAHFKDWPPQLVFEILNEPNGAITQANVNTLNADILGIIRGSGGNNATRAVIIGNQQWNGIADLETSGFVIPSDGSTPHLIANFHYYNPWTFAGQSSGTWGSSGDIATMTNDVTVVKAWAANHGNIPLYMGEFGVTKQFNNNGTIATVKTDAASRITWYTKMAALAHQQGIPAIAWDDNGDFKLYDRVSRTFETAIKTAILGN